MNNDHPDRTPDFKLVDDFLGVEEAWGLFDEVLDKTPWQAKEIRMYGKSHPVPRLTCWFGESAYKYSGIMNDPTPWNDPLMRIKHLIEGVIDERFNSCLANLYRDGNDSVSWHADDEPELGPFPTIASVSLGQERLFKFKHRETGSVLTRTLTHGSLLVMQGRTQKEWLHCVPKSKAALGPRINLTFRNFNC